MAIFSLRGCVILLRTIYDKRESLGVHYYQKDPKSIKKWLLGVHYYQKDPESIKKWLSYGFFLIERLLDSIENHMEQKGTLGCSFVSKRSKIRPEIAELLPFSH